MPVTRSHPPCGSPRTSAEHRAGTPCRRRLVEGRAPRTRSVTLYRLTDGARLDDALDHLTPTMLDEHAASMDEVDIAGRRGVWIHAAEPPHTAEWCSDARRITGIEVRYQRSDAGGLLFVDVDDQIYVIGFGKGHLWLDDAAKDMRFGLGFAVRCLDADQIHDLVRRLPGSRGRTDSTLLPGGANIRHLGIDRHAEIVRRLGGLVADVPLTAGVPRGGGHARGGAPRKGVKIEGGCGLRIRIGTRPENLIDDIRNIAEVCQRPTPHPELAFVENIQPVTKDDLIRRLDERLDGALGGEEQIGGVTLTLAVPETALDNLPATRAYRVRIGGARARDVQQVVLEDVLRRTRLQRPGERAAVLRKGTVELLGSDDGTLTLGTSAAVKWVEAGASLGERRFFLMEGQWYELATGYHDEVRDYVARLLPRGDGNVDVKEQAGDGRVLDLPAWQPWMHEKDYNLHVADVRPGYTCLDRHGVTTRLHRTHGVEICDLLGPAGELIHVKRASSSAPLSHLFAQGMVSAQTLLNDAQARKTFATLVRDAGGGRVIPDDYVPTKIVFAVLLKDGEQLDVDTLFPFSQVMLRQTALTLEGKAKVEILPIRMVR